MCFLKWIENNNTIITLLFSFIVAISTVVYAYLTKKLVKETIIMRRIQTDPKILIDIIPTDDHPFLLNMIIENIGNGPALNIKFNIINAPKLQKSINLADYGFVKNGIKYLSGGNKFKTLFLSTIEEGIDFTKELYNMEVYYEDIKKRKYVEKIAFDFSYLSDLTIAHTDSLYNMLKEIKEISKTMKVISQNMNNK